ncbi:MAG: hypothetical protein HY508_12195 [Acidobacteria bacterium]|nr:hypothetical protein [Acidobacteriota bacterium]
MNRQAVFVLCSILAVSSCGGGPSSNRAPAAPASNYKNTIRQITIHTPAGWLLTIEADGSGNVGYGSSAHDFAPFPVGTFDFAPLRDELLRQSGPAGSMRSGFAVAFARAGEISTTARYVSDFGMMKTLFERAVASADKPGTRVAQLYATIPPVPAAPPATGKE